MIRGAIRSTAGCKRVTVTEVCAGCAVSQTEPSLRQITADTTGLTQFVLQLGPFGGAFIGGWQVRVWALAYLGLVSAIALFGFHRKDL